MLTVAGQHKLSHHLASILANPDERLLLLADKEEEEEEDTTQQGHADVYLVSFEFLEP